MADLELARCLCQLLLSHIVSKVVLEALLERCDADILICRPRQRNIALIGSRLSRQVPGAAAQIQIWLADRVEFGSRKVRLIVYSVCRRHIARTVICAHVQVDDLLGKLVELVSQVDHVARELIHLTVI